MIISHGKDILREISKRKDAKTVHLVSHIGIPTILAVIAFVILFFVGSHYEYIACAEHNIC